MVRHSIHIRLAVSGVDSEDHARDLLNRAYYSIIAFASRRDTAREVALDGKSMDIVCGVLADSADAAASLVLESFAAAKSRDPILSAVTISVNRPRSRPLTH